MAVLENTPDVNLEHTDLDSYKRELLARSESYRQALRRDVRYAVESIGWVPKTLSTLRFASPVLLMLAPALAFAAGRWRTARSAADGPPKRHTKWFGRAIAAFRIFQQVKPLWDGYRRAKSAQV